MIVACHLRLRPWPPTGAVVLLILTLIGLTGAIEPSFSDAQPSEALQARFLGPIDVDASPDGKILYVAGADAQ